MFENSFFNINDNHNDDDDNNNNDNNDDNNDNSFQKLLVPGWVRKSGVLI